MQPRSACRYVLGIIPRRSESGRLATEASCTSVRLPLESMTGRWSPRSPTQTWLPRLPHLISQGHRHGTCCLMNRRDQRAEHLRVSHIHDYLASMTGERRCSACGNTRGSLTRLTADPDPQTVLAYRSR